MEDVGGRLTRKEKARRERMVVRRYFMVMVWDGLLGS